ncbi:MAG TPA: MinD/ParA family protein [Deltaproteobacteria bacterium]|nr:MinD/ParA family protein [Deltaproteobacteria bacterium]
MDQAYTLRDMAHRADETAPAESHSVRVLSVTSGKGGVGKTNSVANLAVAFSKMGKRVLLLDADLGLGNVDVLLGLAPKYNIGHLLRGERTLDDVLVTGPAGVLILPAASGIQELTHLGAEQRLALFSHIENLERRIDIMIIDTGAGISNNVLFFNTAAQDIIVVATHEPTSITDAYALMKVLSKNHGEKNFRLLVNAVKTRRQALEVYRKISLAAERFLDISVDYLGCVLYDENVARAVVRQKTVIEAFPRSQASRCYEEVARTLGAAPARNGPKGGIQFFWRRMLEQGP